MSPSALDSRSIVPPAPFPNYRRRFNPSPLVTNDGVVRAFVSPPALRDGPVCVSRIRPFLSYSQLRELTAPEGYILIHESGRIVFEDFQIAEREGTDFYGRELMGRGWSFCQISQEEILTMDFKRKIVVYTSRLGS